MAYSTVVYVDETDKAAIENGLFRASRAYEGLLPLAEPGETIEDRLAKQKARFIARGEIGASNIVTRIFEPDFIMENELVFIGSPETVAKKLRNAAEIGFFNTFMGEFNFADLPEPELMRSIRLFGEKVIPALREYEPF
jgi:alkanesulfonate monooxygenase SsuD/methylene tetrahydromethanopterin reductase-like flavin-dependent oxidoreductase (luciferase family)